MAPETPNLYEVQKTYEALIDPTKKEDQDLNSKLAFDETRIFKTEFERQYYLASLKGGEELQAAIDWLNINNTVKDAPVMRDLLKRKKLEIEKIQAEAKKALEGEKLFYKNWFKKTEVPVEDTVVKTVKQPAAIIDPAAKNPAAATATAATAAAAAPAATAAPAAIVDPAATAAPAAIVDPAAPASKNPAANTPGSKRVTGLNSESNPRTISYVNTTPINQSTAGATTASQSDVRKQDNKIEADQKLKLQTGATTASQSDVRKQDNKIEADQKPKLQTGATTASQSDVRKQDNKIEADHKPTPQVKIVS